MLTNSPHTNVTTSQDKPCTRDFRSLRPTILATGGQLSQDNNPDDVLANTVEVVPSRAVSRRGEQWHGFGVEVIRAKTYQRIEYNFRSRLHLLAAYQQGVRREGISYVEGLPRSALRDTARKLTLVPAGHEYREVYEPRTLTDLTYFYFDPSMVDIDSGEQVIDDVTFRPKLFFDNTTIWNTATKLRRALDTPGQVNRLYVEALSVVLLHELTSLNRGTATGDIPIKGGLATWQQRIATEYIDVHLHEQIPLSTLAHLTKLSTFHFCRAFKQSFGVPPHRYHTNRRIEQAKVMLAERKHSVTEVGLTLGFSETSSFTAVFRKITGLTPSHYHRALE